MADQSRQTKLAAAKKKLKEFQQKSTPPTGGAGAKKKRKVKGGTDTPTEERRSPDSASNPDADHTENSSEEPRPLSSTESLRQLSQQLNGLLSESQSSYVNGDSAVSPPNEKELEAQNQELAAALDSSRLTNSQLSAKLGQLTQQTQELTDQLQKERKDYEQKFVKEQGAMREQLQVHIQTIGILVSEKSELQTALSSPSGT